MIKELLNGWCCPPVFTNQGGDVFNVYRELERQQHLLLCGCTGSGKSVVLNGLLDCIVRGNHPNDVEIWLLDPKKIELFPWASVAHCRRYEDDYGQIINAVNSLVSVMFQRYDDMKIKGARFYDGRRIVVIFDEFGDIMQTRKKELLPPLGTLARLSRAANISLYLASQNPSRKNLDAQIVQNMTGRLALHCMSPIESRQIIGINGAESLPPYGFGILASSGTYRRYQIPMVGGWQIKNTIAYATNGGGGFKRGVK